MVKTVAGVVFGAIAYFVWGTLSWTVIPWHNSVVKSLPQEQLISDTLKTVIPASGFYIYPTMAVEETTMDPRSFAKKYKKGPTGIIVFSAGGKSWMSARNFMVGFLAAFGISAVVMVLLSFTKERIKTVVGRVALTTSVGLVVFLSAHLPYWNWFSFPTHFTEIALVDTLISFFVLGLVQSWFVPVERP